MIKKSYFNGTEPPKKYKPEKLIPIKPRFDEPIYNNYDLYDVEGKQGPGSGFYQNMHKYKSVKDFINKKRKLFKKKYKNKNKMARRILLLSAFMKKAIDFSIDDQIKSNTIIENYDTYNDYVQIGGNLDQYLPLEDFEGKSVDKLNFGRDYIDELQLLFDDLILNPKETDLYGLPDGIIDKEDLDSPSKKNPYYGTTDSGNTSYNKVWFQ